jgi:acid phosphatase
MPLFRSIVGLLAVALLSSSCAAAGTSGAQQPTPSGAEQHTPGAEQRTSGAEAPDRAVTKLLVYVVENHSLDQMRRGLPRLVERADRYGYATGYHALTHPSLGNYLAIAGGSTFDVTDDHPPADHPVAGESVFGQAIAAGKKAGLYADGMPSNCATEDGGRYAVRHNPWAYFVDERAACAEHDVPLTGLADDVAAGRLPNAGMVIPDVCNDAHNCDLATADAWLDDSLGQVLDGPDWRSGHLAVVITADEDDHRQDNLVLTTVLHPGLQGREFRGALDHYSLTRLYDEVLGAPLLRNARSAASMADAFGLDVAGAAH